MDNSHIMFIKIEFSDDDLSSDDTGGNSEELDVPGEVEIDFDDDIGRVVMADTDNDDIPRVVIADTDNDDIGRVVIADTVINEEETSMSGIGEIHIGYEIVSIEECDLDKNENQKITDFMGTGCGCTVNKGKPCFDQFNETHYSTMRNNCAELDHISLDIVFISQIMANTNISDFLEIRGRKHQRQNYRTTFYHLSRKVSRK